MFNRYSNRFIFSNRSMVFFLQAFINLIIEMCLIFIVINSDLGLKTCLGVKNVFRDISLGFNP